MDWGVVRRPGTMLRPAWAGSGAGFWCHFMRWPIRLQIFVPFAVLLAVAVVGGAMLSSRVAARRAGTLELQRLARVVDSLASVDFPYSPAVLRRMQGLSGAEFVAVDAGGKVLASTLNDDATLPPLAEIPALDPAAVSLNAFPQITLATETYFVSAVDTPDRRLTSQRLYILYPRGTWERLQWDAAWPPLGIGVVSLLLMLLVSGWLAHRIGRRIDVVRALFSELEAGRFPRLAPPEVQDELGTLLESANQLSARLESLQAEVARTERLRILAQVAGGFAHQLRNALTGARMAVQLHQRHCTASNADDTLAVALSQLSLTEQQVRGLLSLSREPEGQPVSGDLSTILDDVERLVRPQATHLQIALRFDNRLIEPVTVIDRDLLRGAVMNLVLNGLDAAGVGGRVTVQADVLQATIRVDVTDSGAGPPESVQGRLGEAFVTSKPEGVGLGLMLAQQAAEVQEGRLSWTRDGGATRFLLEWPQGISQAGPALEPNRPAHTTQPPSRGLVGPSRREVSECETANAEAATCPTY